ncbi:MAG: hypothetical protein KBT31_05520, partial [Firmicutes bacterium]|nr:hypothetical protein [Candidatus Colimorpha enterica]
SYDGLPAPSSISTSTKTSSAIPVSSSIRSRKENGLSTFFSSSARRCILISTRTKWSAAKTASASLS